MSNPDIVAQNWLDSVALIAQSVYDKSQETKVFKATIIDATQSDDDIYTLTTGVSQFSAKANTGEKFLVNDLVYVQEPEKDASTRFIIGKVSYENSKVSKVLNPFGDIVFYNGDDSLIDLETPTVGVIANSYDNDVLLGSWRGEYAEVSRLGIGATFNTMLKTLGAVRGDYGIKIKVYTTTSMDRPTYEYYMSSDNFNGDPYNYLYGQSEKIVYSFDPMIAITGIDVMLHQGNNFKNEFGKRIMPTEYKNIFASNLYVGVGRLASELTQSKFTIYTANGMNIYSETDTELSKKSKEMLHNLVESFISWGPAPEKTLEEELAAKVKRQIELFFKVSDGYSQTTIDNLIKEYSNLLEAIKKNDLGELEDSEVQINNQLSVMNPLILYRLIAPGEKKVEQITSLPEGDTNNYIIWLKQEHGSEILDDPRVPARFLQGWKKLNDKNCNLNFYPDYSKNEEVIQAVIHYNGVNYISNELHLTNYKDAAAEKVENAVTDSEIRADQNLKTAQRELEEQRERDQIMINNNIDSLNDIILEAGYYDGGKFVSLNNNFPFYTRSGLIDERYRDYKYTIKIYSSNNARTKIIRIKDIELPEGHSMITTKKAKIPAPEEIKDGAYFCDIGLSRMYNPSYTNNIVTATVEVLLVDENGTETTKTVENNVTLVFGYTSCLGTQHSLTSYWTNSKGEYVYSLVPGEAYTGHLVLDGQEVSPSWSRKGYIANKDDKSYSLIEENVVNSNYVPEVADVMIYVGIVTLANGQKLRCYLPARISYNEDNILEGSTEITYLSDGQTHFRDNSTSEDSNPVYRLELLLSDEDGNQEYLTQDQYMANNYPDTWGSNNQPLRDSDGNVVPSMIRMYREEGTDVYTGPTNWSIFDNGKEMLMRTVVNNQATGNGILLNDAFTLTAVKPNDWTKTQLIPKEVFPVGADEHIFAIRTYSAGGCILATIPLLITQSRYPSFYIDEMAGSEGININEELGTIYSPRLLAGKYEDSPEGVGNKVFTGVAIGDYAGANTETSMQSTGLYGFKQGVQAYAFKDDGTGFIGQSNCRLDFNKDNKYPIYIGGDSENAQFKVDKEGNVTLSGNLTWDLNSTPVKQLFISDSSFGVPIKDYSEYNNEGTGWHKIKAPEDHYYAVSYAGGKGATWEGPYLIEGIKGDPGVTTYEYKYDKLTLDAICEAIEKDPEAAPGFSVQRDNEGNQFLILNADGIQTGVLSADILKGGQLNINNIDMTGTLSGADIGLTGAFNVYQIDSYRIKLISCDGRTDLEKIKTVSRQTDESNVELVFEFYSPASSSKQEIIPLYTSYEINGEELVFNGERDKLTLLLPSVSIANLTGSYQNRYSYEDANNSYHYTTNREEVEQQARKYYIHGATNNFTVQFYTYNHSSQYIEIKARITEGLNDKLAEITESSCLLMKADDTISEPLYLIDRKIQTSSFSLAGLGEIFLAGKIGAGNGDAAGEKTYGLKFSSFNGYPYLYISNAGARITYAEENPPNKRERTWQSSYYFGEESSRFSVKLGNNLFYLDIVNGGIQVGKYNKNSDTQKQCRLIYATSNDTKSDFLTVDSAEISSDRRLKKEIISLKNYNNDIEEFYLSLNPVSYTYKDPACSGKKHIGFIAQDVEATLKDNNITDIFSGGLEFPEENATSDNVPIDEYNAASSNAYRLNYLDFIALNTEMVQRLYKKINLLEKKIQKLEEEKEDN